jgi:signal transduction histidine kinase/ActR/RegA family two-component response regulator
VLRVGSLVDASLRGIDTSGIALLVDDETAPPGERLLHARTGGEDPRGADVRWVTTLDLGGRQWSLLFAATPTYLAARRSWQPWTLFGAGLLVTGLLVGYIVVSARRTAELLRENAERRRAEGVAEQRRVEAEVLADIGRRISQSLDPRDVAQRIADSLRTLLAASNAAVWRLAPSSGDLVAVAASGDIGEAAGGEVAFPVGISAVGLAVRERRTVTTLNVLDDPGIVLTPEIRHRVERTDYRSVLAMPLRVQDTVIGALGVGDRPGRAFKPEEIKLTEAFADQAAIALENARLYAQAQQAYEDLARTQAQLVQVQKMEAVGRLASGVAHDFNNLLTIIKGRGELLLRRLDPGDRNWRDVDLICKTSARAAGVVAQLLAFGRRQILQPKVVDLNVVVTGMLDMLRRLMGEDIEVAFKPALSLARIRADVGQLEQVIVNLAANARDAMPRGGRWTLETTSVDLDGEQAREHVGVRPGRYVLLSVTDTGMGMDEAVRRHLFEPFFTTKELGRGTGLGLATAYGIIKQSGGAILAESEVGHGTTFEVYLPHVDEEEPAAPAVPAAQPRGGTETVLVVEDEAEVRNLTSEILQGLGYRVLEAAQPGAAVRVAEQHRGRIDLLLTDVVMPELSGQRLAERLRSTRPDLNVLYMSGYTDDAIVRHGVLTPGTHLLEKPFSATTLAAKVREALDAARHEP